MDDYRHFVVVAEISALLQLLLPPTCETLPAPVKVKTMGPSTLGIMPYWTSRPRDAMADLAALLLG